MAAEINKHPSIQWRKYGAESYHVEYLELLTSTQQLKDCLFFTDKCWSKTTYPFGLINTGAIVHD